MRGVSSLSKMFCGNHLLTPDRRRICSLQIPNFRHPSAKLEMPALSHNRPEVVESMKGVLDIKALQPDDVARSILYAMTQPPQVNANEILIRPTEPL
jgi:hypothetical protein